MNTCKLCNGNFDFRKVQISEILGKTGITFTPNLNRISEKEKFKYVNKFNTAESFADWLEQFFTNLPDEYVHAVAGGHSTTVNTVQRRFDIVSESINEFTNK